MGMSLNILKLLLVVIVSYLLGSLNFAVIISKVFYKQDIRNFGSGNAGMTNMLRTFGKKAAVMTFAGDFFKGVAAVLFAKLMFSATFLPAQLNYLPEATNSFVLGPWTIRIDSRFFYELAMYLAIFGAITGHLFPIFFKFKGGKGISVAFGAAMTASPFCTLSAFAVFLITFLVSRMVSLASIVCAPSFLIFSFIKFYFTDYFSVPQFIAAIIFPCVIFYTHRENMKRILNGTEYKFKSKKSQEEKEDGTEPEENEKPEEWSEKQGK